jgi:hypothetical protein
MICAMARRLIFLSPLLWIAMTRAGAMLSVADGRADPVGGQVFIPDTSIEHADPHCQINGDKREYMKRSKR